MKKPMPTFFARALRRLSRCLPLPALLALACMAPAHADTPIVLFKSFAGNVNFTGTQVTLRTKANGFDPCATTSSANMVLSGLPANATVLAAYLYWAASGSTGDYDVTFENKALSAPAARQYSSTTVGYPYFSGAADVTTQVKAKGNGSYAVGGLTISKDVFCAVQGVLGGFQLLVVYSQASETFRVLNVYEGFQYIRNSSVELTLANFLIPASIDGLTGRIGHLTWEGDSTLSGGGETLKYNNVEMVDSLNAAGNQFNSVSNINNDTASYGIDFDAYTVRQPVIAPGQKSARTMYQSGSDLVLLNAEIIAAPNVPATDRGVTMTLDGPLVPSAPTTYTITVTNNGPMDEAGTLSVTTTLQAALIYGGASGSGWNCAAVRQVVTCTYPGVAKTATTLPPITLTVTPAANATGLITTSATVGGTLFDYYDGNDTSTLSNRLGAADFTPVFRFTDKICVHNKPFNDPAQPCKPVAIVKELANKDIPTYITYVVKDVPTALASADSTLQMRFALSCHNPLTTAGIRPTYDLRSTKLTLPTCTANGAIPAQTNAAWSSYTGVFYPGGSPTSKATGKDTSATDFLLRYLDVGRVELFVSDNAGRLGTTEAFVSRPLSLSLEASGPQASGATVNQAGTPASATDPRFVAAGAPFKLTVKALIYDLNTPAPNFGRETPEELAVVELLANPAKAADGAPLDAMLPTEVVLDNKFGAFSGGVATGSDFFYDDVGVIQIDSHLTKPYLGTGDVTGSTINVGRFYPDHFDTKVESDFECGDKSAAGCPVDVSKTPPLAGIAWLAYAGQPFRVTVTARSQRDSQLNNYRGDLARNVTLTAYQAPNGTVTQTGPASGSAKSALSNNTIAAASFDQGIAVATPTYSFPAALAYSCTSASSASWPLPVSAYLRAVETSGVDSTTSKRAEAVEGGIRVVAGRMWVPNAKGSAALAMNIQVGPQYYGTLNGAAGWYDSLTDSATAFAPQADVRFAACTNLKGASACKLALKVDPSTTGKISGGVGTVKLAAPGTGSSGTTTMSVVKPAWLPSTCGMLTYGTIRSPYIFLRELY